MRRSLLSHQYLFKTWCLRSREYLPLRIKPVIGMMKKQQRRLIDKYSIGDKRDIIVHINFLEYV
jgi:hypothetical protein